MKYCSKCGNELFDEAVICPKCGCATGDINQKNIKAKNTNQSQINKSQALGAALILGGIAVIVVFVILVLSQL